MTTTDAAAARRTERLATGAQLYTLNRAGLLAEAMGLKPGGGPLIAHPVTASRARLVLTAAQERGDWPGSPLRLPLSHGETVAVLRYNQSRERQQAPDPTATAATPPAATPSREPPPASPPPPVDVPAVEPDEPVIEAEAPKNEGARGIGTAEGVRSHGATAPTLADLGEQPARPSLRPLADVIETWLRNVGRGDTLPGLRAEIADRERSRGETLTADERARIEELWRELQPPDGGGA